MRCGVGVVVLSSCVAMAAVVWAEPSEIERRMMSLQERNAGTDDPQVQAFVAELDRRARGNPRAETEMKRVALCLVDRSCGTDRLYVRLYSAIRAIDQSSAALSP